MKTIEIHFAMWVSLAALTATGCASSPQSVRLLAGKPDIDRLTGVWEGEYTSPLPERWGTIHFSLSAGDSTATGNVLLFPGRVPYGRGRSGLGAEQAVQGRGSSPAEALRIEFVIVEEGIVSGRLERYRDPTRECWVSTVFTGRLQQDSIEGTYVAIEEETGNARRGEWKVSRRSRLPESRNTP